MQQKIFASDPESACFNMISIA